jgi:hypothetical protein
MNAICHMPISVAARCCRAQYRTRPSWLTIFSLTQLTLGALPGAPTQVRSLHRLCIRSVASVGRVPGIIVIAVRVTQSETDGQGEFAQGPPFHHLWLDRARGQPQHVAFKLQHRDRYRRKLSGGLLLLPNRVQLDQLAVYFERTPDEIQKDHFEWGFRFTALYGSDYKYTFSDGILSDQYTHWAISTALTR